jgi:hypothetical protein
VNQRQKRDRLPGSGILRSSQERIADSCRSRPPKRDDVAHRNGMMSPGITR